MNQGQTSFISGTPPGSFYPAPNLERQSFGGRLSSSSRPTDTYPRYPELAPRYSPPLSSLQDASAYAGLSSNNNVRPTSQQQQTPPFLALPSNPEYTMYPKPTPRPDYFQSSLIPAPHDIHSKSKSLSIVRGRFLMEEVNSPPSSSQTPRTPQTPTQPGSNVYPEDAFARTMGPPTLNRASSTSSNTEGSRIQAPLKKIMEEPESNSFSSSPSVKTRTIMDVYQEQKKEVISSTSVPPELMLADKKHTQSQMLGQEKQIQDGALRKKVADTGDDGLHPKLSPPSLTRTVAGEVTHPPSKAAKTPVGTPQQSPHSTSRSLHQPASHSPGKHRMKPNPIEVSHPLNREEVQGVSDNAFREAYDFYKKNAVGDPKTRKQYLLMLRGELAEYEENADGTKDITSGLLKSWTDENYRHALAVGNKEVAGLLSQLNSTKFPTFEEFRNAREKATQLLCAQLLQNNVAYRELSEKLWRGLEDLSVKVGLEFKLSETEKEKEQVYMAEQRKAVEQKKRSAELDEALMHSQQMLKNLETEKRLLQDQTEKLAREWKSKMDFDSKLRTEQIASELHYGFEARAQALQKELVDTNQQALAMMKQMQKENREHQEQLTQVLLERQKIRQQEQMRQQYDQQVEGQPQQQRSQQQPTGLLGSLLAPVTGLVGNLLQPGTGLVGNLLQPGGRPQR